jgi:hypothetical protein
MLQIHDILVWIRIRIRGSMPLTNGSGSWIRILLFSSLTFKMPAKIIFNTIFFCLFQCCGSGMFIPDPDFYPSRIPDLGSRIQKQLQKREG